MGDPLADAVASAILGVTASLPSLARVMRAGGMVGNVAICSSSDEGAPLATTGSVSSSVRVVANVADFPRLEATMPVDYGSERRIIVGLKNTGGAAWFLDLSKPLQPVSFRVGGRAFAVFAAVVDDSVFGTTIGGAAHSVTGLEVTVYVPVDDWPLAEPPRFGIRCTLEDGRRAVVQAAEKGEHSWKLVAVADMREGER